MRAGNSFLFVMILLFLYVIQANVFASDKRLISSEHLKILGLATVEPDHSRLLEARKSLYSIPGYEAERCSVAKSKRMDVNGDGIQDIVALINYNCTADPVEVLTLCSMNHGFIAQRFPTERAVMARTFIDIDADGKYELLLNVPIPGNAPHSETFYWTNIYSWREKGYSQANEIFLESYYLKKYLPLVCARIAYAEALINSAKHYKKQNMASKELAIAILEDCRKAIKKVISDTHTQNVRNYKRSKPWED